MFKIITTKKYNDLLARIACLEKTNDKLFCEIHKMVNTPKNDKAGVKRNRDGTFARKK